VVIKSGHVAQITSIIIYCFMPLNLYIEEKNVCIERSFMLARGHATSRVIPSHDLPRA
jgi:hypothetical protein